MSDHLLNSMSEEEPESMDAEGFVFLLQDLILEDMEENGLDIEAIRTFEESMLLTNDKGLVIHMSTGEEFQVTVVRSK